MVEQAAGDVTAAVSWTGVYEPVRAELDLVAARVVTVAATGPEPLKDAATVFARRPGKLVRPALMLLSGLTGPEAPPGPAERRRRRLVAAATAFELLHLASLTHDDILDASPLRRGEPSVWGQWGPGVALLTGDHFYGKAMSEATRAGGRASQSLCRTIEALLRGEALQIQAAGRRLGRRAYMALATAKTAVFCQESCGLGATLARAGSALTQALRGYGRRLGQAYQLTDDVLDWRGDPARMGKPALADLASGHLTFPVIVGLARRPARVEKAVRAVAAGEPQEAGPVRELGSELEACGALEETVRAARRLVERAINCLAALPAGTPRDNLAALAAGLIGREA